jgi:hypothetical protein
VAVGDSDQAELSCVPISRLSKGRGAVFWDQVYGPYVCQFYDNCHGLSNIWQTVTIIKLEIL